MAELLGQRKRGRKKEQLRLTVTELVSKLKASKPAANETVVVNEAKTPKGKAEVVTFEVPKGSAIVPVELTRTKKDENAREQIRLGIKDSETAASISSVQVRADDGEEFAIFIVTAK